MAKQPKVKWYGDKVAHNVKRRVQGNLQTAAWYLAHDIRAHFPASGAAGTRSGGGDRGNPSAPGEIPHVQTGYLKRNIGVQSTGKGTYRVGTGVGNKESVGYALWLEKGTSRMAARPFLRPGLKRSAKKINEIVGRQVI
jgi:HK97 gp10 family phage protein